MVHSAQFDLEIGASEFDVGWRKCRRLRFFPSWENRDFEHLPRRASSRAPRTASRKKQTLKVRQ